MHKKLYARKMWYFKIPYIIFDFLIFFLFHTLFFFFLNVCAKGGGGGEEGGGVNFKLGEQSGR